MTDSSGHTNLQYSVVIPVYNSADIVAKTVDRTIGFFEQTGRDYQIVLVNDGSPDDSWNVIKGLAATHSRVLAINLLRNYGQHTANICGFNYVTGDYVITMDDDLQNPPEEIEKLIGKALQGHDFVSARFERKKHASYRRLGSLLMNWINRNIFNTPKDFVHTNFRIISRRVVKRILEYQTHYPYTSGLCAMFSSNPANVLTRHAPRESGKSNYSLFKLLSLAFNILFSYSNIPVRLLTIVGVGIAGASFFGSVLYAIKGLVYGSDVPGWLTLVILMSFFNGVLFFVLSLMAEYSGRILTQLSHKNSFYVKEVSNEREP